MTDYGMGKGFFMAGIRKETSNGQVSAMLIPNTTWCSLIY